MTNLDLAHAVLIQLKKCGVKEIIVCAGARNAPLIEMIERIILKDKNSFEIFSYFEERSAAFFALGRINSSGLPVAVIMTSGTAVAETLPAVIEAYYQCQPLIIVSADRPKSYRGSGAPQSIEQKGLFGIYAESSDWDRFDQRLICQFKKSKPLHLNICFDEPLIDQQSLAEAELVRLLGSHITGEEIRDYRTDITELKSPLVLIGEIPDSQRTNVKNFLLKNSLFFISESQSGLKNNPELKHLDVNNLLSAPQKIMVALFEKKIFRSIVRVGGIPTLRLWRELEFHLKHVPVFHFSQRHFGGLSAGHAVNKLEKLFELQLESKSNVLIAEKMIKLNLKKLDLIEKFHDSEQSFFKHLANIIETDPIYLGNSLPIREWDEMSEVFQNTQKVSANRGANGIDGQISTYFGWSQMLPISWCVVGDLTALYDLSALGLCSKQNEKIGSIQNNKKRIVVINNSGGQIFSRVFKNQKYLNPQTVDFSAWAKMYGWTYLRIKTSLDFTNFKQRGSENQLVVEILPNNLNSLKFNDEWQQIIAESIANEF